MHMSGYLVRAMQNQISHEKICMWNSDPVVDYHAGSLQVQCFVYLIMTRWACTGFIRVREMSGRFKFFQGQGIVREFYVVSGKNECLLKCQGNVREFYNFQLVSIDEKQKMASAVFLTFWIQAKSFWQLQRALNIERWQDLAPFASWAAF